MTITFLHLRSWCIIILLLFFTAECLLLLTYSIYFSFHLICLIYCIELGSLKDTDNLLDHPSKTINSQRESDTSKSVLGRNDILKPRVDDHKQKLGRSSFFGSSSDKASNMGNTLPVSMAAQAVDELIEAIEMEEKSGALEAITGYENGSVQDKAGLPFPPPPPPKFNQNAYNQYEGDDEDVDIEEIDSEIGCGEGNSEVDIMKD
ncbi:hypothetical protein ZOSMA_381G00140 [Zostera marina]|uniref:Uncharacterized protein n=1 Tax=Zostera marina TaxID=29655 RepID=A0A0K9P7D1_ZOSMR|nr:hypothetical protein ZOSMA_381G00140 [Zostera marina]